MLLLIVFGVAVLLIIAVAASTVISIPIAVTIPIAIVVGSISVLLLRTAAAGLIGFVFHCFWKNKWENLPKTRPRLLVWRSSRLLPDNRFLNNLDHFSYPKWNLDKRRSVGLCKFASFLR